MVLPLYPTPFTDDLSTINADFLNNYLRTQIPRALDGIGGGSYALAANIVLTDVGGIVLPYLRLTGTAKVQLDNRSIGPRVQKAVPTTNDPTTWSLQVSGLYMQQIANAKDYVIFALDVPDGATLTEVRVHLRGAAGHGLLPTGADRPDLAVHEIDNSGGSTLVGGVAVSDGSADVTAYQLKHRIDLTGLSHTIDRTQYRYTAVIGSETGANYVAGLRVFSVDCTYTVDEMDDG